MRLKHLLTALFLLTGLLLSACSSTTSAVAGMGCTAFGNSVGVQSSLLQLTNFTVQLQNAPTSDNFSVQLPNQAAVPFSGSTYTFPGTVSLASGSTVVVTDTSTNQQVNCTISKPYGGNLPTVFSVSAAPSTSEAVNATITLTAKGSTGPFTFTPASAVSGVTFSQTSPTTATVKSSVATTFTVNVTDTSALSFNQQSVTLTFGGGSQGIIQIAASPSTTGNVGQAITLTATQNGVAKDVVYSATICPTNNPLASCAIQPVTITPVAGQPGVATVVAQQAGTFTISAHDSTNQNTGQVALTFTGTSSLQCWFLQTVTKAQVGARIYFVQQYSWGEAFPTFLFTSNTGEAVRISNWDAGEPWHFPPSYPIPLPVWITYSQTGIKNGRLYLESATRPGVRCNDGAPLAYTLTIE